MRLSNIFLAIGLATALLSCVTQSACLRKFPTKDSTYVVIQRHDSIIHDTIKVPVPYQELTFSEDSPCPPQTVYHKSVSKGGLTETLDIKDGKITGKCIADSLQVLLDKKTIYATILERHYAQSVRDNSDKQSPFWKYGFLTVSVILLLILAGLIFVKA